MTSDKSTWSRATYLVAMTNFCRSKSSGSLKWHQLHVSVCSSEGGEEAREVSDNDCWISPWLFGYRSTVVMWWEFDVCIDPTFVYLYLQHDSGRNTNWTCHMKACVCVCVNALTSFFFGNLRYIKMLNFCQICICECSNALAAFSSHL